MWIKLIATVALLAVATAVASPQYRSESERLAATFANFTTVNFFDVRGGGNRVINGESIQRNQLPWHVIVNVNGGKGRLCAGSLVSSSFVLTEANALRGARSYDCYLGAHFKTSREIVRRSTKAHLHPNHKPGSGNYNIGLLQLDFAFTDFTEKVHPVQLPYAINEENPYAGRHGWVSGFGSSTSNQFLANQWSTVRVLSDEECFATFPGVVENVICSIGHDGYHSGPAIGDGGAPLVALEHGRYVQIGVFAITWYNNYVRPVGYVSTFNPEIRKWIRSVTTI